MVECKTLRTDWQVLSLQSLINKLLQTLINKLLHSAWTRGCKWDLNKNMADIQGTGICLFFIFVCHTGHEDRLNCNFISLCLKKT